MKPIATNNIFRLGLALALALALAAPAAAQPAPGAAGKTILMRSGDYDRPVRSLISGGAAEIDAIYAPIRVQAVKPWDFQRAQTGAAGLIPSGAIEFNGQNQIKVMSLDSAFAPVPIQHGVTLDNIDLPGIVQAQALPGGTAPKPLPAAPEKQAPLKNGTKPWYKRIF